MGLLTIVRKQKLKERQMRILILGLDNAGKTTIVRHLLGEDVYEVSPTLGFIIKTIIHNQYSLNIWDIGGQSSLRPYWRNYFEITDAIIWVIDSADHHRLSDCKHELHSLLQEERLASASLLILANKQDIPSAVSTIEIAESLELNKLKSHTWHILPCSTRQEINVSGKDQIREGLEWVVNEVEGRIYYGTGKKET